MFGRNDTALAFMHDRAFLELKDNKVFEMTI